MAGWCESILIPVPVGQGQEVCLCKFLARLNLVDRTLMRSIKVSLVFLTQEEAN